MPNYVLLLVPVLALCAGGIGGYYLGRYHSAILDKIRTLEERGREEEPTAPAVVLGAYTPPQQVSTTPDDRAVGLVESKTPERMAWDTEQAIEREGRGITPR